MVVLWTALLLLLFHVSCFLHLILHFSFSSVRVLGVACSVPLACPNPDPLPDPRGVALSHRNHWKAAEVTARRGPV